MLLIQNVIGEEEDGYVAPEYGGVIFTQNPYLPHHCLIEISPGMPISSTYSGRPSLYVLDTRKKSIVYKEERAANVNWGWAYNNSTGKITKKAYLRNTCENWITTHLPAVNNIVDKLTNKFGKLLDIEFAFHKGQFVILQIRPICLKPHKPIRYSPIELRKIYSEKNYNLMKPIYSLPCLIIVHDKLITNKTIISIDKKFSEGYILMLQNIDNFLGGSLSEAGYPAFTKLIRNCKLIILLGQYNRQNHGTIIARELGIDTCFLNKPIIFKLFRYLKYKSPKTIIECSDFKIVFNTSTYDVTFYSNQLFDYLKKMIKS